MGVSKIHRSQELHSLVMPSSPETEETMFVENMGQVPRNLPQSVAANSRGCCSPDRSTGEGPKEAGSAAVLGSLLGLFVTL